MKYNIYRMANMQLRSAIQLGPTALGKLLQQSYDWHYTELSLYGLDCVIFLLNH